MAVMRTRSAVMLLFSGMAMGQSPVITAQPANQTVTLGQPATFSVQASNVRNYQWHKTGATTGGVDYTIPGATSASYTFTPTAADTGSIFYVAFNNYSLTSTQAWLHVTPRTDRPTITNVESFGTALAARVADSFGLGIDPDQDWEFASVAAIGGRWVRGDGCQWEKQEIQIMPQNTSGGFTPSPDCAAMVASAKKHGLHLDSAEYWAPPHSQAAAGTTVSDTPAGSGTVTVRLTSGTLTGWTPRSLLLFGAGNNPLHGVVGRIDGGAPILSVAGSTLTLAEPTASDIPAGSAVTVNVLLYPPVYLADSKNFLENDSVKAWLRYVSWDARYRASQGVTGVGEQWNEPENGFEEWDDPSFYDHKTPNWHITLSGTPSGEILPIAASTLSLPAGEKLLNGFTNTEGGISMYYPPNLKYLPVPPAQLNKVFEADAIHPYGTNPEQGGWLPDAMDAAVRSRSLNSFLITAIGGQVGSDRGGVYYNRAPFTSGGDGTAITETGFSTRLGSQLSQARFDTRQFLMYSALHVYPIIFYKATASHQGYDWFNPDSPAHPGYQVAGVFKSLLSDIGSVASRPVSANPTCPLPRTSSFTGFYPLAKMSIVGAVPGELASRILEFTWQKTYTVPQGGATGGAEDYGTNLDGPTLSDGTRNLPNWAALKSPAAVPDTEDIPAGYTVPPTFNGHANPWDVVTKAAVPATVNAAKTQVTFPVADDPVEVAYQPASATKPAPPGCTQ